MTVREIWAGNAHYTVADGDDGTIALAGQPVTVGWALREVLVAGVLASDPSARHAKTVRSGIADSTAAALLALAAKGGLDAAALRDTRHGDGQGYVKGAVASLLPACIDMLDTHGRRWPLDTTEIAERAVTMIRKGLAVLALARQADIGADANTRRWPSALTFVGLVGLATTPSVA
jgi:hypothetical protein